MRSLHQLYPMSVLGISLILLLKLYLCSGFLIEPWYENLQHFGPLATDGWNTRPMTIIEDFTYRIENLSYASNQPFMFVQKLPIAEGEYVPPLGILNWKQGKIGMRSNRKTQPGGSAGYIPQQGIYSITLRTSGHPTNPNSIDLEASNTSPSVIIQSERSIVTTPFIELEIVFSESVHGFNPAHIIATNAVVNASSAAALGLRMDGSFVYTVNAYISKEGAASFDVKAGAALSRVSPYLRSSPAPSWTVLYTRIVGSRKAHFGKLHSLRDKSRPGYPKGGWYVSAMHANYIPTLGQVLLSGFGRRGGETCYGGDAPADRRAFGLSFLIDPDKQLVGKADGNDDESSSLSDKSSQIVVSPINEDPEYRINTPGDSDTRQESTSWYQDIPIDGDVIYCAGHTTLSDGSVLYVGGARYANLSSPYEMEWGLDYARLFDPKSRTFRAVRAPGENGDIYRMPLGTAWYPTAGRLPDGRVLVTGGFSAYGTNYCSGPTCLNPQINVFDYPLFQQSGGKTNPWRVLVNKTYESHDIDPGIREYTRIFVLPQPVFCGGYVRQVLMLGKKGVAVLLNTDENTPMDHVLCRPPGGARPSGCADSSEQSSAVPLMHRGGELMILGGCYGATQQRIDIYNVQSDSWISVDTGIKRNVPATLLLPDGKVLLISGENPEINQIEYFEHDASSDPRYPQIFDPETLTVMTEIHAREDTFRGYHNFASIHRDGSIILGGGFNQFGDVGCENPNIRMFRPSYLFHGPRPVISPAFLNQLSGEPFIVKVGQLQVRIPLDAPITLHSTKGVALLAVQDFTHSYGENQRYIPLPILDVSEVEVLVSVPDQPVVFDGMYHLFLLSDNGVPSVGLPVRVCSSNCTQQNWTGGDAASSEQSSDDSTLKQSRWKLWLLLSLLPASAILCLYGIIKFRSKRNELNREFQDTQNPMLDRSSVAKISENPLHNAKRLDPCFLEQTPGELNVELTEVDSIPLPS